MATDHFFDETTEQSAVKTAIVWKYFWAWAKVIMPTAKKSPGRIAYIDLFAGPGRYKDGTKSTPLLILEKAIENPDMCQMLVTMFNDKDDDNSRSLEKAIRELPGIEKLKHQPQINSQEVGAELVKMFERMRLVPTLFFVDPWGYKGLSLRLVNSVLKDWGCDCIFFFNYNRISMGLNNDLVREHMDALFGQKRADELRLRMDPLQPHERELVIVEEICQALKDMGGKYVLPFRFRNSTGRRTSHHLIFVSKNSKGYEIMKDIMARESSEIAEGVASFEYSPQMSLFGPPQSLETLAEMLVNDFAGQTLTMGQVYEQHNVDRPYIKRNYKDALMKLEVDGRIKVAPHRKGSFADHVLVTFPTNRRSE
jgi:three-Cys-motif partner protein